MTACLTPSGSLPGDALPDGATPHLRTANVFNPNRFPIFPSEGVGLAGNSGTQPVLLILVQFTNRTSIGTTPAQWAAQFFGATNSAKHFYSQASYGQLTLAPASESHSTANDGVIGWLSLPYAHPDTRDGGGDGDAPARQRCHLCRQHIHQLCQLRHQPRWLHRRQ